MIVNFPLFIELEYPRELLIVPRIASLNSYDPFLIYTIEFGRDLIDYLEESREFEPVFIGDINALFKNGRTHDYDQIKERIVRGFSQKQ